MAIRVACFDQLRAEIHDLFNAGDEARRLGDTLEDVARIGARLRHTVLEADIAAFLGRDRYERREPVPDARSGSRNGTAGSVTPLRTSSARSGRRTCRRSSTITTSHFRFQRESRSEPVSPPGGHYDRPATWRTQLLEPGVDRARPRLGGQASPTDGAGLRTPAAEPAARTVLDGRSRRARGGGRRGRHSGCLA